MKFNRKFLNWSAWITLILTYVLPYQSTNGFATNFGYPFPFFTMHKTPINISLFLTESINPLYFALDILIIYLVISLTNVQLVKMKCKRGMVEAKNTK